jgi:hypothetical protein
VAAALISKNMENTNDNKKLIVPAVIAVVVIVAGTPAPIIIEKTVPGNSVSGQYNSISPQVPSVTVDGLVKSNGVWNVQKVMTIASGQNLSIYTNKTNSTMYFTEASIVTAGTASSSVNIYAIATSSSAILTGQQHYIAPPTTYGRTLLSGVFLATTTVATTTSTITEAMNANPARSNGLVAVPAGWSLWVWIQNGTVSSGNPASKCTQPTCAQATSTELGVTPLTAIIKGFSTSTEEFNQYQY